MKKDNLKRRDFFRTSIAGLSGAVLLKETPFSGIRQEKQSQTTKLTKKKLGRTGFVTSIIGAGAPRQEAVLKNLIDSGVNYIDTAENYGNGRIDTIIGNAIVGYDRKKLFITSKLKLKENSTKEDYITRTGKCLERLKTDYIDCMMFHMPETIEKTRDETFHEAMKQLKEEGKIKHIGISHHGSYNVDRPGDTMEKLLLNAVEDGRFDVLMLAYNFINDDRGDKVLEACAKKNIGTVIMKSNPVSKYYYLESIIKNMKDKNRDIPEVYQKLYDKFKLKSDKAASFIKKHGLNNPDEINEAAIKFVLDNKNVSTVAVSFSTFQDVEKHLKLPFLKFGADEKKMLEDYKEIYGSFYCRHGCGDCEHSCPHNVPVNTIMRYNHYFVAQNREKEAMVKYKTLSSNKADICADCKGYCESACPYDVPVQGLLNIAHSNLTIG